MAVRIHNFNPGPAALPLQVLEQVKEEFTDFKGSGMSITEVSHRSAVFEEVLNDAIARIRRLLKVPDNYKILFSARRSKHSVLYGAYESHSLRLFG